MAGLCDHFPGRFPSEVLDELDRLPMGLLSEVIEAKCYRQAKGIVDAAETGEKRKALPDDPMIARVQEIEMEIAAAALQRKRDGG